MGPVCHRSLRLASSGFFFFLLLLLLCRYATFAALAGVEPADHKAARLGLPPLDSLNLWPYLSGASEQSPRTEIFADVDTLLRGEWKLVGANPLNASDAKGKGGTLPYACWMGPVTPRLRQPARGRLSTVLQYPQTVSSHLSQTSSKLGRLLGKRHQDHTVHIESIRDLRIVSS